MKIVRHVFLITLILGAVPLRILANEQWEQMSLAVQHGFVRNEQTAADLVRLMYETIYGSDFIDNTSLNITLEQRELDQLWLVYGKLKADSPEDALKLLGVIDKNSARVMGISNFTKNQNPYSNFIIPNSKKGYIANKKIALEVAQLLLMPIYGQKIVEKSRFKASLRQGVWYISLNNKKEDVPLMKIDQRSGAVLGISFRLDQLQQL